VHENPSIIPKDITGDRDTHVYVLNEEEGNVVPELK
jgi:hypothetical protein